MAVSHKPFDWVVFDASGTLFNPVPHVGEVYARVGKRYGSQLCEASIRRNFPAAFAAAFGKPIRPEPGLPTNEAVELARWRTIVTNSLHDLDAPTIDRAFVELWDHFADPHNWEVFGDVEGAFELAHEAGLQIAIASNFDRRLKHIVQSFHERGAPFAKRVGRLFISADIGWSKPDPRFYEAISQALNVGEPQRLIMIGDDPLNDRDASCAAGWQGALVDRNRGETLEGVLRKILESTSMA